ncbi:MAG TPA: MFS transporter [Nocardioidaceae bacterium]|nr:MFS transporter [Nocardioidaceae bacterium]
MEPDDPTQPQPTRPLRGEGSTGRERARSWGQGTGRATKRGARAAARATATTGRAAGRGATRAFRLARRASHAEGAGESGLARLFELHAVNAAGDSAVAVALAGTLFFQVPTGEARGQVALFLALTLLPFAIVAPLIGPFLDRFRRGRRWAIGSTMALRGFLCWVLGTAVVTDSVALYPAALGVLVASKAYQVTRASAVPRLIPPGLTLVRVNSRMGLASLAGGAISAPLAVGASLLGPEWALRYAFLVFVAGTVLAILLPSRVDSAAGEEQIHYGEMDGRSRRSLGFGFTPTVVTALRCNIGLRALSGFLTMFMAFLLRAEPFAGWEDRPDVLLGLVIGAVGVGGTIGTLAGSWLRNLRPDVVVLVVLVTDALVAVGAAVFYSLVLAVTLGVTVGLCQQLGKLSLDALIQDEVPEHVRTSVFARSETMLQLSWVLGGGLGIAMPLIPRLGLGVAAGLLLLWVFVVLRRRAMLRQRQKRFALPSTAPQHWG